LCVPFTAGYRDRLAIAQARNSSEWTSETSIWNSKVAADFSANILQALTHVHGCTSCEAVGRFVRKATCGD